MNAPSMKRWLLACAVLNLFLLCAIAGGAWRWWAMQPAAAQPVSVVDPPSRGLRYAADELAPAQRQAYRAALRDARRDMGAQLQASRDGRSEVMRLLQAPQFDRAAAAAALARVRDADAVARARFEAVVVDFAATLDPPERQRFAAALARRGTPLQPSEQQGSR